jgi:hypothetical protein
VETQAHHRICVTITWGLGQGAGGGWKQGHTSAIFRGNGRHATELLVCRYDEADNSDIQEMEAPEQPYLFCVLGEIQQCDPLSMIEIY